MATEIKLPRLGQGMESGTIVKWLKSEGDAVKKGEPLYELDTDKVTQEVEADATGVLLKIAVQEGEVPVGQTVAVIGEQGEEVAIEVAPEEPQTEGSRAPARDAERERGSEASAQAEPPSPATARRAPTGASRLRRWRVGSRASAASTSRSCAAPVPTVGSSPRTWSGRRRRRRLPVQRRYLRARWRSFRSRRSAGRSRAG